MFEGLDGGGHIAVQDAVNMFFRIRDLRIAVSGEILDLIDEVIFRRILDILDPNRAFFIAIKICRFYLNRGGLGIIDRGAGDLVGIGLGR